MIMIMTPFKICRVDLQLKKFAQRNVELVPDTMELLTDTELTQYFIQTWRLDYNDPGCGQMKILLSIRFSSCPGIMNKTCLNLVLSMSGRI